MTDLVKCRNSIFFCQNNSLSSELYYFIFSYCIMWCYHSIYIYFYYFLLFYTNLRYCHFLVFFIPYLFDLFKILVNFSFFLLYFLNFIFIHHQLLNFFIFMFFHFLIIYILIKKSPYLFSLFVGNNLRTSLRNIVEFFRTGKYVRSNQVIPDKS